MIGIPSLFAATFLLLSLAVSLLIKYFVFFEIEPTTLPPSNSIILVNSALFLYSFKEPVITKINPSQDLGVSSPMAVNHLLRLGYKAINVSGGMKRWTHETYK
jgi:rhodanese-related sulfurtransferase